MATSISITGVAQGPDEIRAYLLALVALNRALIELARRRGAPFPRLYESGVRYAPEPRASATGTANRTAEDFAPIPVVLARGWGDCDDLASWRCAELQSEGYACSIEPRETPRSTPAARRWHIVVVLPDGSTEDPSARLNRGGYVL